MKLFVAHKAFLFNEGGNILLVCEGKGDDENTNIGKWDVPGGRMQEGETPLQALQREIYEEVGIDVYETRPFYVTDWRPMIKGELCQIIGIYHALSVGEKKPRLSKEHDEFLWVDPSKVNPHELIGGLFEVIQFYLKQRSV